MRILVEPSDFVLYNSGDAAMLEVGVTRLSSLIRTHQLPFRVTPPILFHAWPSTCGQMPPTANTRMRCRRSASARRDSSISAGEESFSNGSDGYSEHMPPRGAPKLRASSM